jgi:hypothetical protein
MISLVNRATNEESMLVAFGKDLLLVAGIFIVGRVDNIINMIGEIGRVAADLIPVIQLATCVVIFFLAA